MFSLAVFKSKDASRLILGQLISQICDKMMSLGLVWVIAAEISPAWITWFLAAGAIPHILMTWFSGSLMSRWGALHSVVWTDVIRGIIFLAAGLFWWKGDHTQALPFFMVMTVLANFASAVFNPAILTLPGQLTEKIDLQQLNAGIDSCFTLSAVLGPVMAAVLYPWLGLMGLFVVNGLSYLVAAILESKVKVLPLVTQVESRASSPTPGSPPLASPQSPSPWQILRRDSFLVITLGAFLLMNLVLTPMLAFLPLFASQVFKGQISTLVSLETALGLGTVIGSVGLTLLQLKQGNGKKAVTAIGVVAMAYLAFTLNQNPLAACIYLFVLGLGLSVVNVSMITLFQTRPAAQDVPVVMSLVNLISLGVLPFSMAMLGGLLLNFELRLIAPVLALILVVLSVAVASYRDLREAT